MRSFVKLQTGGPGLRPRARALHARCRCRAASTRRPPTSSASSARCCAACGAAGRRRCRHHVSSMPPFGGIRSEIEMPARRTSSAGRRSSSSQRGLLRGRSGCACCAAGRLIARATSPARARWRSSTRRWSRATSASDDPDRPHDRAQGARTLPAGRRDPVFEIVGVVADAQNQGSRTRPAGGLRPPLGRRPPSTAGILVRTSGPPDGAARARVKREIWAVDRDVALTHVGSLTDSLKRLSYAEPRLGARASSACSPPGPGAGRARRLQRHRLHASRARPTRSASAWRSAPSAPTCCAWCCARACARRARRRDRRRREPGVLTRVPGEPALRRRARTTR